MKKNISSIAASVLIIFSCSAQDDHIQVDVIEEIIVEERVFDGMSNFLPVISTSRDANLFMLSNRVNPPHINVVDSDGNLVHRFGSEGSGPGELEMVLHTGFDEQDNAVALDGGQLQFQRYISESEFSSYNSVLNEKGYSIRPLELIGCDDNWYFGIDKAGYEADPEAPTIAVMDASFNLERKLGSFDPYLKGNNDVLQSVVLQVDCKDELLYATHGKVPFIKKYDLKNDELISRIENMPDNFNLSPSFVSVAGGESWEEYLIDDQSFSSHIILQDDYIIHVFINSTKEFFETNDFRARHFYAALYDRQTEEYLGVTEIEGAVVGHTQNGHIIQLMDDNPENFVMRKIKLRIDE